MALQGGGGGGGTEALHTLNLKNYAMKCPFYQYKKLLE